MGLSPTHARRAVVALAVTYFALWACAPITAMPPPTPMVDEREHEMGFGGGYAYTPGSDPQTGPYCPIGCNGPDGILWYRGAFERLELGAALGAGATYGVGLGGHLRAYAVDSDHVRFGGRVDLGLVYAGAGIPFAVGSGPVWVYTEPWIGANLWGPIRLPLGINVTTKEGLSLSLEGAYHPDAGTGPGLHGALGVGFQL